MKSKTHHIIRSFIAAAALYIYGSICVNAQELHFPERWHEEFCKVSPLFRNDTVTICFLGDVMMHTRQIENAHRINGDYDFSTYFVLLEDRLKNADLTVANMEFTLAGEPYSGYPVFSAPDRIAEYMAECGTDIFLCANNHIYDKGIKGAERTLETYRKLGREYGISHTGLAGNEAEERFTYPLMKVVKGLRIAMLNFTYATNGGKRSGWPKVNYMNDRDDISLAIEAAKRNHADFIIALAHWGNEYELRHSHSQEDTAAWLTDMGTDLIIGAHPHVVQDTASFVSPDGRKTVPVAYSLGNAVSNMSARNTQLELMATARIVRDMKGRVSMLPLELTFLWCSRPGGFNGSYTVIPVEEYIEKRELWQNDRDYVNMVETYRRVKKTTGIE